MQRATAGLLGRWWFAGVAVLPVRGDFQRRRQHSATTTHTALPVCEWPSLGMSWGTARSNAASAVFFSSCDGACTGGCGRAGQMIYWGLFFAGVWRFPEEDAAFGNLSA